MLPFHGFQGFLGRSPANGALPVVLGLTLGIAACASGHDERRPMAALASSPESARDFAALRPLVTSRDAAVRASAEPRLVQFILRNPYDRLIVLAHVYLALLLVDRGADAEADAKLKVVEPIRPGTPRDLAVTVRARWLRHQKRSSEAFALLQPLVGKVVDPDVRELFNEEMTTVSVEAGSPYEAIAYMDAWLRTVAEDDRELVRTKIAASVKTMDRGVLEGAFRAMQSGQNLGYSVDIRRILANRLAEVALAERDATLAHWLASSPGATVLLGDERAIAIGELALRRRGVSSIEGRTIGLLLPASSRFLQEEAAEAMRGVAWALGLPRATPDEGDRIRLVTRDDGGDPKSVEGVLDDMAGEGVAVVIGGFVGREAARALAWAESRKVPFISLTIPREDAPRNYGFLAGESRQRELDMIGAALAERKIARIAAVVERPVAGDDVKKMAADHGIEVDAEASCDARNDRPSDERFPFVEWQKSKVPAFVTLGPEECIRELTRVLVSENISGTVVVPLEGASTLEIDSFGSRHKFLTVSAGLLPVRGGAETAKNEDLAGFIRASGRRPVYWTALGRDAGALARLAVLPLPNDVAPTTAEVEKRRELVRNALREVKAPLWTTEATGMDARQSLPRTLSVVDLAAKPKK
ncbi:MAG: ABC transporter substrate-binding protein [Polyangiaceae bacterium]